MSIISGEIVKNFYKSDPQTGWVSPKLDAIQTKEQAQEIHTQCISDARMERFKAIGKVFVTAGMSVLLGGLTLLAIKIATLVIGLFAFPLAVIPPLYGLVTLLGGLGVGLGIGVLTFQKFIKDFADDIKRHWSYSNHLYQQAHAVNLLQATF